MNLWPVAEPLIESRPDPGPEANIVQIKPS
jgi:hypothetical protein